MKRPDSKTTCSDPDFISLFENHGAAETARLLGIGIRTVYARRVKLEKKLGRQLTSPDKARATRFQVKHPHRVEYGLENGTVLIGSDAHYWPGFISTAHKGFVHFARKLKPKIVCMNGDAFDGASISRFPPINWEDCPSVADEIEACKDRMGEIQKAAKNAKLVWTLGNHDGRFETTLATHAKEYAGMHGVHLKDHFPHWEPAWSLWINDDVVIKHRYKAEYTPPTIIQLQAAKRWSRATFTALK